MEAANASLESQDIANSMGAGPKNEEAPKAKAATPKPRVVSKKELEDSGMSLRDYLNNKRGLTRRKESKPSSPALIDPSNIRSGVRFDDEGLIDPSNIRSGRREFEESQRTAKASDSGRDMRTPRYTPPGSAPKQTTQKPKPKVFMPSKPDNSFPGSKFAKGGSVSSASSRADGCATKGKTKGTMVKMNYGGKC
jgi:hypothetical protein